MIIFNLARFKLIDPRGEEIRLPEGFLLDYADDNQDKFSYYNAGVYSMKGDQEYKVINAKFEIVKR